MTPKKRVLQEDMNWDASLAGLKDDELIAEVQRLVTNERKATAALLRSLTELDARRLYLREGCSSLFTYCTQVLHLAEGSAYNRIEAARAARRFPALLDALEEGALTLTSIRILAPHLTADNCSELIAAARHKSKREVEVLVAALQPKPAVPTVIRKLPVATPVTVTEPAVTIGIASRSPTPLVASAEIEEPVVAVVPAPKPAVMPLAPDRYKVQLTISREARDKLRRVQDLLRHVIPTGDAADIFDRALTLLLADLERRRCAEASRPRLAGEPRSSSRHIPAAVRREVWRRDEGRCAFMGSTGRCRETGFLEFHHVEPYAAGGLATAGNIQLRCRAHNLYEVSRCFGDGSDAVRESRVEWRS
jgi:hypothetical protein